MTAIRKPNRLNHPPRWLARKNRPVFSSGSPALDKLTGGIPFSSIVEISGQKSAGRTSLLISILGTLLRQGHVCAYIDATNSFDPVSADGAGLPLERLLWVRSGESLEKAFYAADAVLQAGGFSLVVLDLADVSVDLFEKIPFSYWFRFQRIIEKQSAVLLVVSKLPVTKTCSSLVIHCHSPESVWADGRYPVLSEIKSVIRINRPAPSRLTHVLLNSYFRAGVAECLP